MAEAHEAVQLNDSMMQILTSGTKMLKRQLASENTSELYKAACKAEINKREVARNILLNKNAPVAIEVEPEITEE